jgi:hypothetical protein
MLSGEIRSLYRSITARKRFKTNIFAQNIIMDVVKFIGGPGLYLILGLAVVTVVVISKYKNRR